MASQQLTDYDSYIHEPDNLELDNVPGDWGLPLLGHTIPFLKDPVAWTRRNYEKHGPLVKLHNAGNKCLVPLGPDLVQQVLTDTGQDFSSKAAFHRLEKFFGSCVIGADFASHKHQRRIMQSAFKVDSLRAYTTDINNIYDRQLQQWESQVGTTLSGFDAIKNLLLVVAAKVFFGEAEQGDVIDSLNKAFIDMVNGTMYLIPWALPGTTMARGFRGREVLENYFTPLLPRRRSGNGYDMLSHFCRERDESGDFYPDDEIINQMMFLMFAAHDTTTAAITNTLYYLTRNPQIKDRLYAESKALGKDNLDFDDLDKLVYLQQVFNEVLRLCPSAPLIPRRTIREVELAGYKVPAHTQLTIVFGFNHVMEEYWSDPFKFDPDRFSTERAEHKQHPFQYHPFGGGAHKCIGMHFSQMEYKCFMHKFILKYDFEARHKKDPARLWVPLPKPADNMPIELALR